MSFEIIDKDLLGRIGRLYTSHGVIETPAIAPVVNPAKMTISPDTIVRMGFKLIMTNAYIIWKRFGLLGVEMGVHGLLGVKTPIMTDSGAYQLMEYGEVDIDPDSILEYQEDIGSDIAVILDIPTRYNTPRDVVVEEVRETIDRAINAIKKRRRNDILLVAPIQGGIYYDVVEECARELAKYDFDVYAIGGPTQIMAMYKYNELVDLIMHAKMNIPPNKPVHLFGAGNPIMLPLAVALGVDLFDSAAYALYARDLRYMTSTAIIRFERLSYLPCNCPVCSKYSLDDLKSMPRRELEQKIALHNLYVIKREIDVIRNRIREGSLWEYIELKARCHPRLMDALAEIGKYKDYIEKFDPVTKPNARGIFIYDILSYNRPEIVRFRKRLMSNLKLDENITLLLLPETFEKPFHRSKYIVEIINMVRNCLNNEKIKVMIYCKGFGLIPLEIDELYPLSQYEATLNISLDEVSNITNFIIEYVVKHKKSIKTLAIVVDENRWPKIFYERLSEKLKNSVKILFYRLSNSEGFIENIE